MAERRMFAKSVVESDPFMDMPAEAQALYFHLCMAADDDGFCDNPRSIMRSCGASNDTMKLLIGKKFVLTFEKNDGFIVVVKHWRLNNYIRKDTYHETKYKEFMRELYFDENQSYSMNPGDGHVPCIPGSSPVPVPIPSQTSDVPVTPPSQPRDEPVTDTGRTRDESLTQVSIGKSSTGKSIVSTGEESKEEGECEGKRPPPAASLSDPEKRRERILFWKKRISFMNAQGYDAGAMYDLARGEGITKDEIDNFKEDLS